MEYHESVDYLESLQRRRPKLGTETTTVLLTHLDRPREDLDCVQIAGPNGKGSTACILERILRDAGLDVGLYTSPDLNDLRERIQVNSRKIPKQRVREFVAEIDDRVERHREADDTPTYFEVLTALALHHFAAEDVDVAVLEVGIGGRYDAPSAVDPVASAVTSVSLEHTDILGDTIEEIARDKAQVAPADAPLVTGASGAALEAIRSEAGADIVNDVSGLEDPEMRFVAADHDASLVVMHSLETPVDPHRTATYDDVVEDVLHELSEKVLLAERAGLDRDQIVVDPGLGFGKESAESFELAARIDELRALGCPVMVGHSRKSMFDRVGCQSGERLPPTLAVTTMAAERGVDVVRVHDVSENVAAVRTVRTADARY